MVFVLLMVMVLVVSDLLSRSQVQEFATQNLVDNHLSYYEENAALLRVEEVLFQDMEPPPMKPIDERFLSEEDVFLEERKKGTDSYHDYWATLRDEAQSGDSLMLTTVSDEERRFNINTLLDSRTGQFIEKRKSFMIQLLKNMEVKEAELNGFLDELKDQMDLDKRGKYENDHRNGPFQRLSDLTLCEHVDQVLFEGSMFPTGELILEDDLLKDDLGADREWHREAKGAAFFKKSEHLPYEEWDQDEIFPGLKDLLTIYGDGKININTAPLPILTVLFEEERTALEIIRSRKRAPFRSVEDLGAVANAQNGVAKYRDMITFSSKYFRVTLQLQQRSVMRERVSLVSREGAQLTTLFRGAIL